jgi:AcrR family transcriptional regulator
VPKAWNDTIEAHRRMVRDRILDTTATIVADHGPLAVTMSRIAEESGIGRATLYKYFSDVEAIFVAWHERQIAHHMKHLAEVADQAGDAGEQLVAVLEAFALHHYEHRSGELAMVLHQNGQNNHTTRHFQDFIKGLLVEGAKSGELRDDVAPGELADYCVHALAAASGLPSRAAIRRLIEVILDGLRVQP